MSIVLTKNSASDVLRYGKADNSPLACKLISRICDELGVFSVACYTQAHTHIDLPIGCDMGKFVKAKRAKFVNELTLSFFIHGGRSVAISNEAKLKDELYLLFCDVLESENVTVSYERIYLPEEMTYYGWNSTPRSKWDMSAVIPEYPAETVSHTVNIEYIDRLAFWNYLHDVKELLNKSELLTSYGAKAFPGYDIKRKGEVCHIVFSEYTLAHLNIAEFESEFSALLLSLLRKRDIWGAVTPEKTIPVLTTWGRLSTEQKFAFSKL